MNKLFVFGLGYSAAAIGDLLLKDGWQVSGTVREAASCAALEARGFSPAVFSDRVGIESALRTATHCLVSAPPGEGGDPALNAYGEALHEAPSLRWIGYLSTIGVYGDFQGGWADEETPAEPDTGRGRLRIEAEQAWSSFCAARGLPLDIFRLAGIYGLGRSPLERIRAGDARRIVKPGQVFNRIHVEDIAQTVAAAIAQERREAGTRLFNVADDEPAPPQDVMLYAAELLGAPPPPEIPFESADLSPMARSFYIGNKRMRNDKIKRELGVTLKYPTYREGLRALVP
ncbi:MAG: SDR family oxidoreductase [Rhodomicrobium sp.]|nr:SDR family oxidoreductase [Rhodomicrobium sp.]